MHTNKYTLRDVDGSYMAPITMTEATELLKNGLIKQDSEGGYKMIANSALAVSQYIVQVSHDLVDNLFEEGPAVIERTASK